MRAIFKDCFPKRKKVRKMWQYPEVIPTAVDGFKKTKVSKFFNVRFKVLTCYPTARNISKLV